MSASKLFFFFIAWGRGGGLNFTRLAVRQWHFWSERFYREERKRESGARHTASGRKTELSCLQRCFLDEQSRYAHVKIKVEKGGRGRRWLVRCPSGQPWVQLDLTVGVRAFPLQGCLAPPPPSLLCGNAGWVNFIPVWWETQLSSHLHGAGSGCTLCTYCTMRIPALNRKTGRCNHNLLYGKQPLPKPVGRLQARPPRTHSKQGLAYITHTDITKVAPHPAPHALWTGRQVFANTWRKTAQYQRCACSRYEFAQHKHAG